MASRIQIVRHRDQRFASVAAAVMALVAVIGIAAQPANAATVNWTTHTQPYRYTKDYYSRPLGMCLHILMEGSIRFQSTPGPNPESDPTLRNPQLLNPELSVYTKASCARTAVFVRTATGADLTQQWYAYSCRGDMAITIGFPWSVFVGPTGHCGNVRIADDVSRPRVRGSAEFAQYNSGTPVRWGEVQFQTRSICLGARAGVTVYRGANSDSVGIPDFKVCGRV